MSKQKSFHSLCAVLLALCLGLGTVTAMAQSQASTGQIAGTVFDSQGAAIVDATVKAVNTQTGLEGSSKTSYNGNYTIVLLPPGVYKITVEAKGFAVVTVTEVEVVVGRTTTLNPTLGASGVQEVVNVTAGAIQVQTTRSEADSVLNQQAINDLPINGRRFQDFVTLTPTAQIDPQRNQISLVGQRGIYGANVNIDGADYNQPFFGGIRGGERSNNAFTVPQEAIKEFQVVASGYTAEFGRSTGGIVNAVTKSGTNAFHGSGFYLHRPKELAKTNLFFDALEIQVNQSRVARGLAPIEVVPAPTQQQWGGSFGGPIKKDKVFFFGAYEQQRFRNQRQVFFDAFGGFTPTPATQEAFDFYQALQVPFTTTNDAITFLGRVDFEINQNNRFNVRYSYSDNNALNANSVGNQIFPTTVSALSNNGTEKDRTNIVVGQMTSFFKTNFVNELRAQYAREQRPRPANSISPNVTNGTIGRFGTVNFLGQNEEHDWRAQIADSVIWTHGAHTAKLGAEYNHVYIAQTFGFNQTGVFNISGSNVSTILDILSLAGCPGVTGCIANRFDSSAVTFLKQIGNLAAAYPTNEMALFAQDSWRIRPNLTINYGLRWEGQYNPSPQATNTDLVNLVKGFRFPSGESADPTKIPSDTKQFGPRVGFAWDPWSDSKTVVRGYAGVYNARTPQLIFAGPFNNFRNPPGDLSIQLPLSTASLATGNPLKTCTTVYCQLKLVGVDLNAFSLGGLPIITADQVKGVAAALGLAGFSPFTGAQPILMAPNFKNPRSYQAGLGIEREVSRGLTLGLDFAYVNTIHLQRNRELNLPAPFLRSLAVDPAQRPFYGLRSKVTDPVCATAPAGSCVRPIPSLGSIQIRESSARSLYRALTFRAKFQRKWGQFNAFYTFSKSLSDDDNERDAGGVGYDDNFNLKPEYGFARLDRRHQFLFSPVIFLPMGIDVSSAIRLLSGRPIDATLGSDTSPVGNEDLVSNDRPYAAPGIPFQRNGFRNSAIYNIDLRGQKRFNLSESRRLIFSVEVFNILNLDNIELAGSTVTNYCSPTTATCGFTGPTNPNFLQLYDRNPTSTRFGSLLLGNNPNAFGGVFQIQFGARFQF